MQTILIATDFSAAAENATRYGFELAKKMQARVILFNSYYPSTAFPGVQGFLNMDKMQEISTKKLTESIEKHDPLRKVEVTTENSSIPLIDGIMQVAKAGKVSLCIVGMKESGKKVRKFFGSTVTALINQSPIPLIVVPQTTVISIPTKIALSSNLNNEHIIDIVRPLKELVECFKSELLIVRVVDKFVADPFEILMKCSKTDWFLQSVHPTHEFIQDDKVGEAVIDFAKENAVDMIAVIAHQHTLIERIFNNSVTEYFSLHSPVPLLILSSIAANKTKISEASAAFCSGKCLVDNGVPKCEKYIKMHSEYEQEISEKGL